MMSFAEYQRQPRELTRSGKAGLQVQTVSVAVQKLFDFNGKSR